MRKYDTKYYDWSAKTYRQYTGMIRRHIPTWKFIHKHIVDNNVRSVLEVGCGIRPLSRKWVKQWQGIDINPNTDAVHEDFLTVDLSPWKNADLFIACGVVEHCEQGLKAFLSKAKEVSAGAYIIGFFLNIDLDKGHRRRTRVGYWYNRYTRNQIINTCEELGYEHELHSLSPRDNVLVLKGR